MIQFSISNLILLYIAIGIGILLGLWLYSEWKRKRRDRRNRRFRVLCRICATEFEDQTDDPIPQCPHCRQRNERVPIQEI